MAKRLSPSGADRDITGAASAQSLALAPIPRPLVIAGPGPNAQPCRFGAGLRLAIARISAVATIHGGLAGFDHSAVEHGASGRVDDFSDLAPVAVGVVDAQGDDARGDSAQVVAALRAPGKLGDFGGVDAVKQKLKGIALSMREQGVAVGEPDDLGCGVKDIEPSPYYPISFSPMVGIPR